MKRATEYLVKQGDTLWKIARETMGAGHLWPSIYIFNNTEEAQSHRGDRLVNPNLIHPGETLSIPVLPPALGQLLLAHPDTSALATDPRNGGPQALAAKGATARTVRPHFGVNPAERLDVRDYGFAYNIAGLIIGPIRRPGYTATFRMKGTLTLQSSREKPLVTFSKEGAEIEAERQNHAALADFVSSAKVDYDPGTGRVSFENSFTVSGHAGAPEIILGTRFDPDPAPTFTLKYKPFSGWIGNRVFAVAEFEVIIEIHFDIPERRSTSVPLTAFDVKLYGGMLMVIGIGSLVWSKGMTAPLSLRLAAVGLVFVSANPSVAYAAGFKSRAPVAPAAGDAGPAR